MDICVLHKQILLNKLCPNTLFINIHLDLPTIFNSEYLKHWKIKGLPGLIQ